MRAALLPLADPVMERRVFLGTMAGGLLAAPLAVEGQPAGKVWRIGYLTPTLFSRPTFLAALRELGYVEGQTIRLEVRGAENDLARLPALAAELVRSEVDIIVAVAPPAILATSKATKTIPIVMAFWGAEGLIESGIVQNFAKPGRNITGLYMLAAELEGKRLELLLAAVPNARTVGVLSPRQGWGFAEVRRVAQAKGVQLHITDVLGSDGYEPVFDALKKAHVDAVLVPSNPQFYRDHPRIIAAAAKRRIPAMYEWGEIVRAGGLLAYGPTFAELDRRVATFVDRIIKGAKPADLPVEQPTKFELVINLKTAKALGLTILPSLLQRADEVIQ